MSPSNGRVITQKLKAEFLYAVKYRKVSLGYILVRRCVKFFGKGLMAKDFRPKQ